MTAEAAAADVDDSITENAFAFRQGGLSNGPIPDPHAPYLSKPAVEKSPFQISANRLEVDENVNRAHFSTHFAGCEVME